MRQQGIVHACSETTSLDWHRCVWSLASAWNPPRSHLHSLRCWFSPNAFNEPANALQFCISRTRTDGVVGHVDEAAPCVAAVDSEAASCP